MWRPRLVGDAAMGSRAHGSRTVQRHLRVPAGVHPRRKGTRMNEQRTDETSQSRSGSHLASASEFEELLTLDDVCRLLNLKKSYLYHLTHNRRVPFIKIGNHVRFRRSDVEQWLSASTVWPDLSTVDE